MEWFFYGVPILKEIWNFGEWNAAMLILVLDFGLVSFFMCLEGIPPWKRGLYKSFLYNDTLFFPVATWMSMLVLKHYPVVIFNIAFDYMLLIVGFSISFVGEIIAVRKKEFTINQELGPSKIWHTVIFGFVFYWMVKPLVIIGVAVYSNGVISDSILPLIVYILAAFGSITMITLDQVLQKPLDAHLEGSYFPWKWEPRRDQNETQIEESTSREPEFV